MIPDGAAHRGIDPADWAPISLVVLLVVMAAAFNLQKFPGFKGTDYHVQLTDASGLHKGNMVQVAGIRVGRVERHPASAATTSPSTSTSRTPTLGEKTQASVQVLNLLGEKYLELTPKGSGEMEGGDTIPVEPHQRQLRHRRHARAS